MMTEGTVEKDEIGITTGIMTETMIVTGTMGGGEVVTALIMTTGGGDAIAMTDVIGTVGITAANQRNRQLKKKATRFNRVAFFVLLECRVI
jgi:hypothetical protein